MFHCEVNGELRQQAWEETLAPASEWTLRFGSSSIWHKHHKIVSLWCPVWQQFNYQEVGFLLHHTVVVRTSVGGFLLPANKMEKKSRTAVSQQSSQSSRNIEESLYWELILGSYIGNFLWVSGGEMLKNTLGTKLDPLEKKRSNRESNLR